MSDNKLIALIERLKEEPPTLPDYEDNVVAKRAHGEGWKGFAEVLLAHARSGAFDKSLPHPHIVKGTESIDRPEEVEE